MGISTQAIFQTLVTWLRLFNTHSRTNSGGWFYWFQSLCGFAVFESFWDNCSTFHLEDQKTLFYCTFNSHDPLMERSKMQANHWIWLEKVQPWNLEVGIRAFRLSKKTYFCYGQPDPAFRLSSGQLSEILSLHFTHIHEISVICENERRKNKCVLLLKPFNQ